MILYKPCHTGRVTQFALLSQLTGSHSKQATGAKLPSVRRNIAPKEYSDGSFANW